MKNLEVTTSFDGFIETCQMTDEELLNMCDAIFSGESQPSFHFEQAKNVFNGLILVYEPMNFGLLLTQAAYNYFIPWVEKSKFHEEPYEAYLNWKIAIEKKD